METDNIKDRELKKATILDVLDGIKEKKKVHCYVNMPFVSTSLNSEDYVSNRVNYFLYPCKTERKSRSFFLYTMKRVVASESDFYLSPLNNEQRNHIFNNLPDLEENVKKICDILEIPQKHDGKELPLIERFRNALNRKHSFLGEKTFLTDSEFDAILSEDLNDLVDLILYQGYKKDERVIVLYKSQLLEFDREIRPKQLVPYQSHSLAFTNTKTGKTSTADTIGEKIDRLTSARLLGYSDAKGVYPGDIDHQTKPFFAEEIGDAPEESAIARYGLNILELGEVRISTGKQSFNEKTWSSLTFHGNIIDLTNAMIEFETLLGKISNNPTATGSRFAIILFGDKYDEAKANEPIDNEIIEKALAAWKCLEEKARPNIMKFFLSSHEWLNQPIDFYTEDLNRLEKQTPNLLSNVKAFITSQKSAYRHIRGAALKLAIIDHIKEFLVNPDAIDGDEVISTAETHLNEITRINLQSFTTITATSQANITALKRHVFDTMPEYQRILIDLAGLIVKRFATRIIPGDKILLQKDFLKDPYQQLNISGKYSAPSSLIQKMPKDKKALNQNLKFFGILVEKCYDMDCIIIKDKNELLIEKQPDEESSDEKGENV